MINSLDENIEITLEIDIKIQPVTKEKRQPQKYVIVIT